MELREYGEVLSAEKKRFCYFVRSEGADHFRVLLTDGGPVVLTSVFSSDALSDYLKNNGGIDCQGDCITYIRAALRSGTVQLTLQGSGAYLQAEYKDPDVTAILRFPPSRKQLLGPPLPPSTSQDILLGLISELGSEVSTVARREEIAVAALQAAGEREDQLRAQVDQLCGELHSHQRHGLGGAVERKGSSGRNGAAVGRSGSGGAAGNQHLPASQSQPNLPASQDACNDRVPANIKPSQQHTTAKGASLPTADAHTGSIVQSAVQALAADGGHAAPPTLGMAGAGPPRSTTHGQLTSTDAGGRYGTPDRMASQPGVVDGGSPALGIRKRAVLDVGRRVKARPGAVTRPSG